MGLCLNEENFISRTEILALILVIILFNPDDTIFNPEILAVIIILWLIYENQTPLVD